MGFAWAPRNASNAGLAGMAVHRTDPARCSPRHRRPSGLARATRAAAGLSAALASEPSLSLGLTSRTGTEAAGRTAHGRISRP
jgi:hypothetical protein